MPNLRQIVDGRSGINASGTSEGATKGWDTRGRGRAEFRIGDDSMKAVNKVADVLHKNGYQKVGSPGGNLTHYEHPDGHEAWHTGSLHNHRLRVQARPAGGNDAEDHLGDVEQDLDEKGLLRHS